MARLFIFLNIFFIFLIATTTTSLAPQISKQKPNHQNFVFPVFRDITKGFYYTSVTVGKPPLVVNLFVDVKGSALWFQCDEAHYNSKTYTPISCRSKTCKQIEGQCSSTLCNSSLSPTCRKDTCVTFLYRNAIAAYLFEDNFLLSYSSPSSPKLATKLPFACTSAILEGLPPTIWGTFGLGSSNFSFVNHLVSSYKVPFKVALCLPSKLGRNDSGLVYIGGGPYLLPNNKDASELFVSTPLIRKTNEEVSDSDDYYIDVKSIEVNRKTLSINKTLLTFNKTSGEGGTSISSSLSHTYLEPSIYKALVKAFAGNAKKEKPVAPFSDCFSSKSFGGIKKTPVISLVLAGGVKWNIYGPNSLVKVSKSVVCFGFMAMDGGEISKFSIQIGGYQMQDNLVEFDLDALKFSFTSSLLLHNTSCSRRL